MLRRLLLLSAFCILSSERVVQAALCGQPDDGQIHLPPNYNSFNPPALGGSYVDPQYGQPGCNITRLTDATANQYHAGYNLAIHHFYGTINAMNANDTLVMAITEWSEPFIIDTAGNVVLAATVIPSNSADAVWDVSNPFVFYYANGSKIFRGTVNVSGHSMTSVVLHDFAPTYGTIQIPADEDLTDDGTKLWLIGNPGTECAGTAILYNLVTDAIISQNLTFSACHKIQIFPSGKMFCTNCNGGQHTIYNTDGSLYWQIPVSGSSHADVGTDLQGREVLIQQPAGTATLDACNSPWNSLTVIDINTKTPINCLAKNLAPWEISYRDSAKGWVLLTTFNQSTCPDYSCFYPQDLISTWQTKWPLYAEEALLVKIDGSQIQRISHTRSRSAESYWAIPRGSISRDANYAVYDSNMDISTTGLADYTDVYLANLTTSPTTASPCDVNGDGATNVADVQVEVNMALKITACPPTNSCSVVGVQRVVNAALGGTCVAP